MKSFKVTSSSPVPRNVGIRSMGPWYSVLTVGSGVALGIVGDGWVDGNAEFVRGVRLIKLLDGELEPSGVRENGLLCVSSVSARGVT